MDQIKNIRFFAEPLRSTLPSLPKKKDIRHASNCVHRAFHRASGPRFGVAFVAETVWDRRRLVGQMASLDDHMLRDIGLTRFDIDSVLADPAMTDPTWRLSLRAREARSNQRAAVLERRQWANLLGTPEDAPPSNPDRRAA